MMRKYLCVLVTVATLGGCAPTPNTVVTAQPSNGYFQQQHPFQNARLFLDPNSAAASWQKQHGAPWLDPITHTSQAVWLTSEWDLTGLPATVRAAREQEALLVVVTYFIPNRDCGDNGADSTNHYGLWIERVIQGLAGTFAVVIMEPDALAADCFDASRAALISESVKQLTEAGHYVYLDAGHSRWRTTAEVARRLMASGIQDANGFSINVANRQTTEESQKWGLELSDLVGDREFVIDTSRNGLGPPPDEPGRDDEWCNPKHQALGVKPVAAPLLQRVAALLWIKRPGESDGPCRGEEGFDFSPTQARNLVANAEWVPTPTRDAASMAVLPSPSPLPSMR